MQKKGYRIIFESYDLEDPDTVLVHSVIMTDILTSPTNCLNFSMTHEQQISLIQSAQDKVIAEKIQLLNPKSSECHECSGHLKKRGKQASAFYDVFTDHHVKIQRLKCDSCGYEAPATVRTLLNGNLSGSLAKIQAELAASYTYRDSENLLSTFSTKARSVNNHNRIKTTAHNVGGCIEGSVENFI